MTIQFVVHDEGDSVGVIVVEGVKAGDTLNGWIMEQDKTITFKAGGDILNLIFGSFCIGK